MKHLLSVLCLLVSLWPGLPAQAATPPSVVGHDVRYKVRPGDTLYSIARHYNLALEHLAFANGLPLQMGVPPGRVLVIPGRHILPLHHPVTGLLVNLPERGVYLFRHNRYDGFFPIAIGQPGFETPTGHFKIISMVKNPTWLPPAWAGRGETVVPAGPANPLGDRWMGLSAPGIGLHATTEPESVGANASHGCMRMYPPLAEALFTKVHKGMPVWIVYDPVKLGMDDGHPVMQVFPDVYHHQDAGHEAAALVAAQGLVRRVSQPRLNEVLQHASGRVAAVDTPAKPKMEAQGQKHRGQPN
jgi:L,D-transpeptidase ErfK/SrfK